MNIKKIILTVVFILLISNLSFSESIGFMNTGIMGSYNPFNPSFWSVGPMFSFGVYSGKNADGGRIGMTFGQTTLTFEKENPFNSKNEMTEYWRRSSYMDWIFGYFHQINLNDNFALRFGADFYYSYAYAFATDYNNNMSFNIGLTGTIGLTLFPIGKFSVLLDVCPGFTLDPFKQGSETFALILPIRITLGVNEGNAITQQQSKSAQQKEELKQKEIELKLPAGQLMGTTWTYVNLDDKRSYDVRFLEGGVLVTLDDNMNNNSWVQNENSVTIKLNNGYATHEYQIINPNLMSGTASNVTGKQWKIELRKKYTQ